MIGVCFDARLARDSAWIRRPVPQLSAAVDALAARVTELEPKIGKPVPDPASAAHTEALEKTRRGVRTELAATRAQGRSWRPPSTM